jgi:hypothetical protein
MKTVTRIVYAGVTEASLRMGSRGDRVEHSRIRWGLLPRVLRQRRHGIKCQNDDVANQLSPGFSATKATTRKMKIPCSTRSGILL